MEKTNIIIFEDTNVSKKNDNKKICETESKLTKTNSNQSYFNSNNCNSNKYNELSNLRYSEEKSNFDYFNNGFLDPNNTDSINYFNPTKLLSLGSFNNNMNFLNSDLSLGFNESRFGFEKSSINGNFEKNRISLFYSDIKAKLHINSLKEANDSLFLDSAILIDQSNILTNIICFEIFELISENMTDKNKERLNYLQNKINDKNKKDIVTKLMEIPGFFITKYYEIQKKIMYQFHY